VLSVTSEYPFEHLDPLASLRVPLFGFFFLTQTFKEVCASAALTTRALIARAASAHRKSKRPLGPLCLVVTHALPIAV
jgi:hypothetical protein